MATLIGAVLFASLLGSLHCAGMCGVFAAFAVGAGASSRRGQLPLQFAYHGGRLVTYAILGALAGLVGAALDRGGSLLGVQRAAAILAGAMMLLLGVAVLLRLAGVRLPRGGGTGASLTRWIQKGQAIALRWAPGARALGIGLLTALLPCGWLWAFVIAAAGTGHPLWGAAVLAAFWLGTVPVLASIGIGVRALTGWSGARLQLLASLLLIAVGIVAIAGRWDLPLARGSASSSPAPPSSVEKAIEHVKGLDGEAMPCCEHES